MQAPLLQKPVAQETAAQVEDAAAAQVEDVAWEHVAWALVEHVACAPAEQTAWVVVVDAAGAAVVVVVGVDGMGMTDSMDAISQARASGPTIAGGIEQPLIAKRAGFQPARFLFFLANLTISETACARR